MSVDGWMFSLEEAEAKLPDDPEVFRFWQGLRHGSMKIGLYAPTGSDSPDFHPIENAFAKLKALLRKAAPRTIEALWNTIGALVDLITPNECANMFAAAGYDPD